MPVAALAATALLPDIANAADQRQILGDLFETVVWSAPGETTTQDLQSGIDALRAAMGAKARERSDNRPLAVTRPSLPARAPVDVQRLLTRGRILIAAGDIGGARLVYEYAAADSDPAALDALAETYDPTVLRTWRVVGIKADPEKARHLYERASLHREQHSQRRLAVVSPSMRRPDN